MLGHRTLNVEDYLGILRRRWVILLIPSLLFPVLAYLYTFTIDPQYVSQTLVLIEQQQVPTEIVRPVVNEDLDSRLASMREQILSRSELQPIIQKYNLYGNKKMSMDDRIETARAAVGIKAIHSEITQSNGLPGFFVSFKASDPKTAQDVCSEITGLFVQQSLLVMGGAVEQTTNFLQGQLDSAKRDLDEKDKALADFQTQYFGRLPTDENTNEHLMESLTNQLTATNQHLQSLEEGKSITENMIADRSQSTPSSVVATQTSNAHQSELQELIRREADLTSHYTDQNPDVIAVRRQIKDLQKEIAQENALPSPQATPTAPIGPSRADSAQLQTLRVQLNGINGAIQNDRKQQADLQKQIEMIRARVMSSPQVEEQFKALTRDYSSAQENYNQIQGKLAQARAATDLEKRQEGEQFRVLDPANLPDAPTYPRKELFALGGLAGGIALGLLISALLEYKDTSLRSERDIWAFTQLPTLAVVAWSGEVAHAKISRRKKLIAIFRPKRHKDLLVENL